MARKSKMDQEMAYLRSAWEEIEDQAIEYDFLTTMMMLPTISRGVWSITLYAYSKERDNQGEIKYTEKAQFRFPNGRSVTFAGELWAVLHRFTNQIAEARDNIKRTSK